MYTVHSYSNNTVDTFITNDVRTAFIVAFNKVCYLGYEVSHVMSNETGEILKTYCKG